MANPLFDLDFLSSLLESKSRTLFARVTALTKDELPIEYIEGKVSGGSINIDGNSRVRRTCSLSLVAKDININDYYWGLKTKIKVEIGVENNINSKYSDIVWFKQGTYIITSFSVSRATNNYTININGKDKMCLLNGDLGGVLPHTTDFGIEEYYDKETGITTYTSIPIKTIIREAVQSFGNELTGNIIINDIEDAGLELLEYRGDVPMYMFRQTTTDVFSNMTLNSNQTCYIQNNGDWKQTTISDKEIVYDNLVDLEGDNEPTVIKLSNQSNAYTYTVAKIEYGTIPGYRLTDLTYAGDLIMNVGETIVAMLDKIVNMLGNFEYFYDLDGKFIFQKKNNYVSIPWLNAEKEEEVPTTETTPMWSFLNSQLITQFQNTPKLENLRNDFAVWGTKKTTAGNELDIHMRYAIDHKPTKYHSLLDDKDYTTDDWDWRELIYRMALDYRKYYHNDDFLYNLAQANPQYPDGHTGYEQYYTDLEGFWRLLYSPLEDAEPLFTATDEPTFTSYIRQPYRLATNEDYKEYGYKDIYFLQNGEMRPFVYKCVLQEGSVYSYFDTQGKLANMTCTTGWNRDFFNKLSIDAIYVANVSDFYTRDGKAFMVNNGKEQFQVMTYEAASGNISGAAKFVEAELAKAIQNGEYLYVRDKDKEKCIAYGELPSEVQRLYYKNGQFQKVLSYHTGKNTGEILDTTVESQVYYFDRYYDYDENTHWNKAVQDDPESLLFWFDFLDAEGSEMGKYAANVVGVRSKAVNDKDVKSIYYREIPQVIFQSGVETYEHQTGYTYIQLQGTMENLFVISSKGKSAKEAIEDMLYKYGCCVETVSLTAIPIYHLEPNSRISVQDKDSGINGEYLVNKITIPLTYNGTMNITATKVVSDIT